MSENTSSTDEKSIFFTGLFLGAILGGLVILVLDKEERKNLLYNLKTDWKSIFKKIGNFLPEEKELLKTEREKPVKSQKIFFRKQGKKLG